MIAAEALTAARRFADFDAENDPYGDHDFGSFEFGDHKFFWKIDHYSPDMQVDRRIPPR